jgi:hypothetical protein
MIAAPVQGDVDGIAEGSRHTVVPEAALTYSRTKYGIAIRRTPMATIASVLSRKYVYPMSSSPQMKGRGDFCFRPYRK